MRLQDIFKTPTVAKALDLLLADPGLCYMQGDLKRRLNVDKATLRVALARLQRLGLVAVDVNPVGVHLNAIMFNDETKQGKALLAFYRRIVACDIS
jgi:DNA-binding MarR family transcriptional regulator